MNALLATTHVSHAKRLVNLLNVLKLVVESFITLIV